MPSERSLLLQTKLHRPTINSLLINRPRLIDQLDKRANCALTLVCAPAGFGKTTLVCNWLDRRSPGDVTGAMPVAWLSLDENDSDLHHFLRYVIAAVRTVYAKGCEQTLKLIHTRLQPPQELLYTTFCNELAALPGKLLLVLDDYHFVRGQAVQGLLVELARHWPSPLHLVLISRISPALPLARLRAKGMLNEIRTADLRFTPQESAAYLSVAQVGALDPATLQLLEERIEGWPAGLHLAALSLRSVAGQESSLLELTGNNPTIAGYLVDEVLAQQIPAIHSFLLKSSVLDRFCAPLCTAVVGEIDGAWDAQACLAWIDQSELFIIPLDSRRQWYRYHHLFQDMLRRRLSAEMTSEQVAELHRRASAWFEDQGLLDEALRHALAAGDLNLVARQMIAGLHDALNREDRPTLDRWLSLLPEEMIQRQPELLMIKAWALEFSWRIDLQARVLQQVEDLLAAEPGTDLPVASRQIVRGQILIMKAQLAYFSNQPALGIELCRQGLALLPPSWTYVRGGAYLFLGMCMQAAGQGHVARQLLLAEYEAYGDKPDTFSLFLLMSLCFGYLASGLYDETKELAQVLAAGSLKGRNTIMKDWGDWFAGLVAYQRNQLETASQHFSAIVDHPYAAQITAYRDAVAGLVMIHQLRGESAAANQLVEAISRFDLEQYGSDDARTSSLRARLLLLQGDVEGAGRWADTFRDPPPDQALLWLEEPQLTRARILVARGSYADLQAALRILDVLAEIADRTHNLRYQIKVLSLRALALDALGKSELAETELKKAVELARAGGIVREFVDLGTPGQALLHRLAQTDPLAGAIRPILAEFPENGRTLDQLERPAHHPTVMNAKLVEPLTPRELEVLTILQEPLSLKEIARSLDVSYATARRHTINLYGKLGVNKRWDAVARSIELGILPAE